MSLRQDRDMSNAQQTAHDALTISGSRVVDAPAQVLFDVVADPSMHHVIDGSGTVRKVLKGGGKLGLGDSFTTHMRIGVPYIIRNTVKEFSDGEMIAWSHAGGWTWRFEFEAVEGGTRVTETFDWSTAVSPAQRYVKAMKWPTRNARNISRTLDRLQAYADHKNLGE